MSELSAAAYFDRALALAQDAARRQQAAVEASAAVACDAIIGGRSIWAFGTGHSHLLVEEIWGRAGGLTCVKPILEPALMLHEGLTKSSLLERRSGLAEDLLAVHPVERGDVLIVVSNSGRNAVPVEFATQALDRGATVIALTSLDHSRSVDSRAPSGLRLFEVADLVIDNGGVPGDAVMPHQPYPVGPTSTMIGALLLQGLTVEIVGRLEAAGHPAPVLESLNV